MGLGITGIELGNATRQATKISQIASSVADNLSRAKQAVPLGLPQLREHDINDAFKGAILQSGDPNILQNGRIIVSSLQQNAGGGQWIAWQRCKGVLNIASAYGTEGTGKTVNTFAGMGAASNRVTAPAGVAIIFVEFTYNYQYMIVKNLLPIQPFKEELAYYVRDDRDMSGGTDVNGVYNPSPAATSSKCNLYSAT